MMHVNTFIKKLKSSNQGSSLVEVVIAVALLVIVSSAVISAMATSQGVTAKNEATKPAYETTVGAMDVMLDSNTSSVTGDSTNVSVKFPSGSTVSVPSKVIRDDTYKNVAIIKKN